MSEPSGQQSASKKFFRYFQHEVTDLQRQIDQLASLGTSGGERDDAVSHCLSGIARLSNEINDASSFTAARDQRTYAEAIKALNTKLQDARASFAPRPKFAFKSGLNFTARKNASAISLNDATELANQTRRQVPGYKPDASKPSSLANSSGEAHPRDAHGSESNADAATQDANQSSRDAIALPGAPDLPTSSLVIQNRTDEYVVPLASADSMAQSGRVLDISRSVVDLSTLAAAGKSCAGLILRSISQSLIICGRVDGAVHLTAIRDSVVVVVSRQFRMHDSSNCQVYLLTTSRPIIEDCSNIAFAPAPEGFTTENDDREAKTWSEVDDFKWLKAEHSPNWSVLDPQNRLSSETWKKMMQLRDDRNLTETLRLARILP